MSNLITPERALLNLNQPTLTTAEEELLDELIAAVSRGIEGYCRRGFVEQLHDEIYPGTPQTELLLRHYPVLGIERVLGQPVPVLRVVHGSESSQRATVQVTATGLVLVHVAAGVAVSNTLAFAEHVTLAELASAVTALGNGWSATVLHDGLLASADLRALQGAFNARGLGTDLRLHLHELTQFDIDHEHGILTRGVGWHGGPKQWRIRYRAGFAPIPDDVQEACAQWTAALYWQTKRDPGLARESIPSLIARAPVNDVPASVRVLLRPYRRFRI